MWCCIIWCYQANRHRHLDVKWCLFIIANLYSFDWLIWLSNRYTPRSISIEISTQLRFNESLHWPVEWLGFLSCLVWVNGYNGCPINGFKSFQSQQQQQQKKLTNKQHGTKSNMQFWEAQTPTPTLGIFFFAVTKSRMPKQHKNNIIILEKNLTLKTGFVLTIHLIIFAVNLLVSCCPGRGILTRTIWISWLE